MAMSVGAGKEEKTLNELSRFLLSVFLLNCKKVFKKSMRLKSETLLVREKGGKTGNFGS